MPGRFETGLRELGQRLLQLPRLLGIAPIRQRSPAQQQRVDEATRALSLYQFPACPYCFKVRRVIRRLRLNIELRDALNDPLHKQELLQLGGLYQTPCLRIGLHDGHDHWLYESSVIIRYLRQRFDP